MKVTAMRERIYNVIEPQSGGNRVTAVYNMFMLCVIVISFVPLFFKETLWFMRIIDLGAAIVFIIDYILRWITADYKFGKKGAGAFVRYPFSLMAIFDLLSILPGLIAINPALKMFRVVRLFKALQLLRIFMAGQVLQLFDQFL